MSEVKRYVASWHMQEFYVRPDGDVVRFSDHQEALDAQRLRADTAETELAKANEKIDRAWNQNCAPDHKACIPGALDAWKRPVPQYLPYDFSGNPGASATQYCNGWNDAGGYWRAYATEVEGKLAAAEQRIAGMLQICRDIQDDPRLWLMVNAELSGRISDALNPNHEAESHE